MKTSDTRLVELPGAYSPPYLVFQNALHSLHSTRVGEVHRTRQCTIHQVRTTEYISLPALLSSHLPPYQSLCFHRTRSNCVTTVYWVP